MLTMHVTSNRSGQDATTLSNITDAVQQTYARVAFSAVYYVIVTWATQSDDLILQGVFTFDENFSFLIVTAASSNQYKVRTLKYMSTQIPHKMNRKIRQ